MKLIIDIDVSPEEFKKIQVFNIKMMNSKITHKIYEAVQNGIPVSDITNEQISKAFQTALAAYWEEKSKHLHLINKIYRNFFLQLSFHMTS